MFTPTTKIIRMIILAAVAMIAGGVLYYVLSKNSYESLPFALGVIVSASLNVLKILMLERSVKKTLDMDNPDIGKNYIRFQYLLRYFMTGVVLVIIGLLHVYADNPRIVSIWGALFGIFTMQIALIAVRHTKLIEDEVPADGTSGTEDKNDESNDTITKENDVIVNEDIIE